MKPCHGNADKPSKETPYLMDVVQEDSCDELLEGLSASSLSLTSDEAHLQAKTPLQRAGPSASTLLSPFSPTLKGQPQPKAQTQTQESFRDGDLSLQPCRKVSVVVHVSYQSSSNNSNNNCNKDATSTTADTANSTTVSLSSPGINPSSSYSYSNSNSTSNDNNNNNNKPQLCLFPLILKPDLHQTPLTTKNGKPRSPTSATLNASAGARDLVVVNPSAFGKFIPSEITMQTARLVAQVANIESEDWARTYRFQQVIWPDHSSSSFTKMAQAMANDILAVNVNHSSSSSTTTTRGINRIVIATGSSGNDKTHVLFGKPKSTTTTTTTNDNLNSGNKMNKQQLLQEHGLLGATFSILLSQLSQYAVCALSIYEIVQEDGIHDLLAPSHSSSTTNKPIHVRQSRDGNGAIVEGLVEYPIDSLASLRDCLEPLVVKHKKIMTRKQRTEPGHVIVMLKVWQSAVQHDLNRQTKCATLTFVDLANPSSTTANTTATTQASDWSPTPSSPGKQQQQQQQQQATRQAAFLRTSVSSLGGVLKGILLKEAGQDTVIPYRSSTLTKVLQRSLDHVDSRVIVLATLSPLSDAYDSTLTTLRYVERLCIKTTGLPKSPFEKRHNNNNNTAAPIHPKSPSEKSPLSPSQPQILMEHFAGKESILHSVITDPRQRLARFYRSQQHQEQQQPPSPEVSEGRKWTGYMKVDPGTIHRQQEKAMDSEVSHRAAHAENEDEEKQLPLDGMQQSVQDQRQSTSLAEYITSPLSPVSGVAEDHSDATSSEPIHKQRILSLETGEPLQFEPSSFLHYRLPPNGRLHSPELVRHSKEKGGVPQLLLESPRIVSNTARQQHLAMAPPTSPQRYIMDTGDFSQKGTDPLLDSPQQRPRREWNTPNRKPMAFDARFTNFSTDSMSNQESSLPVEPVGIYQDPTSGRSSSTGFLRQIATLESSVDAIKTAHYGVWQASASSIRQLKDFHVAQQSTLNDLIAQRDDGVEMARKSQEEYSKLSQKLGDMLGEKDAEINALKDSVAVAQAERSDVEKIAEEAIAAQDALERDVSELEKQLLAMQSSNQGSQAELHRLSLDKAHLSEELHRAKSELFGCRSNLDEKDCALENLENERQQIARQLAESENAAMHLKGAAKQLKDKRHLEREEWRSKLSDLQRQNKTLCSERDSRETEHANQVARLEAELRRCKEELAAAKGQLEMHLQQDQIISKSIQSERAAFRHEIGQLKSALNARSSERDSAMEQLDQNRQKYHNATADHDRTRDDLVQRVADVEELSAALQQAIEEQETLRDELFRKDRSLEDFQVETRHRVQRVTADRDEMATLLEKTIAENRALLSTNEKLQAALERQKVERNSAVRRNDDRGHAPSDIENSASAQRRESQDNDSPHYRLQRERDSLEREREKLRKLLRDVNRDQNEVWKLRRKEQEVLSALRLETDGLLLDQKRGQGSLQREVDSLRAERDNLQDRLKHAQRDLNSINTQSAKASSAHDSVQPEIEPLQWTKDVKSHSDGGINYRTMDRFETPLHYSLERDFIGSLDLPPPQSEARSAYASMLHHQESNKSDKDYIGSLAATPTSDGEHVRQLSRSRNVSLRNPPPDLNPLAVESATSVPLRQRNTSLETPRRDASISMGIVSDGRKLVPKDSGRLAGVPAQSSTGRYQEYYLSDEDDKELLITALKQKVKLLERAFIVGDEKPKWRE
jgi:Kinesin motor domain